MFSQISIERHAVKQYGLVNQSYRCVQHSKMCSFNVVKNELLLQVVNQSGLVNYTNIKSGQPIAVTWGVFPGSEIVQVSTV